MFVYCKAFIADQYRLHYSLAASSKSLSLQQFPTI